MNGMMDLHTHSTASDGSYSPGALVAEAKARGISCLALTDHDTLKGLEEAEREAVSLGLSFVRGIEIEIDFDPGEFHLLGLGLERSEELSSAVEGLSARREERNRKILGKMTEAGIGIEWSELEAISMGAQIGRPHFASLLIGKKVVRNREQAFGRYLAKGRPFYCPKECISLPEAVDLIHEARGLAIVAHPMSLFVSWGRLVSLFDSWKYSKIDGIEAWHPGAKESQCLRLQRLACEKGFLVTAGSDFHGASRPERKLGITAGGRKMDRSFLEEFGIPSDFRSPYSASSSAPEGPSPGP